MNGLSDGDAQSNALFMALCAAVIVAIERSKMSLPISSTSGKSKIELKKYSENHVFCCKTTSDHAHIAPSIMNIEK